LDTYRTLENPDVMETDAPSSNSEMSLGSGLVIDVDRQTTRAVLFETVEGQGRFVAATELASTLLPPIAAAAVAMRAAIHGVSAQTGFALLGERGLTLPRANHEGVDFFAMTGQPAQPIRLAVISTGPHPLTQPLIAVARNTVTIVEAFDQQVRTEDGALSGAELEAALRDFRPDMVVVLAGEHTQSEWPTAVGTLGTLLSEEVVSQAVILGSDQLQQAAIQALGVDANLMGLDPAQYESADVLSAVESELNSAYEQRVNPGSLGPVPEQAAFVGRGRAAELVTRFLARRRGQRVLSVGMSDGTVVYWSDAHQSAGVIRPDFDVNLGVKAFLRMNPRLALDLLPFSMSEEDLHNWVLNRALRPTSLAGTARDEAIESALAGVFTRQAWQDLPSVAGDQVDLIVGGPLFASWSSPAVGVLTLLNAIQPAPPSGLVEVVLDAEGLLGAAGAIGEFSPALAADAVEYDLALPAATIVVVEGSGVDGDLAVRGELRREGTAAVNFTVPYGSIHLLPLTDGAHAELTLTCDGAFTIGGEERCELSADQLRGGSLGVVIDARGRPLPSTSDASLRAGRVANWLSDLGVSV
jgi:hypothetical protein